MKTEYKTDERPIKKAGYSSARLHAKRDRKRREADARDVKRAQFNLLSLEDQIKALYRNGTGGGSGREITRRQKQLAINEGLWPVTKK